MKTWAQICKHKHFYISCLKTQQQLHFVNGGKFFFLIFVVTCQYGQGAASSEICLAGTLYVNSCLLVLRFTVNVLLHIVITRGRSAERSRFLDGKHHRGDGGGAYEAATYTLAANEAPHVIKIETARQSSRSCRKPSRQRFVSQWCRVSEVLVVKCGFIFIMKRNGYILHIPKTVMNSNIYMNCLTLVFLTTNTSTVIIFGPLMCLIFALKLTDATTTTFNAGIIDSLCHGSAVAHQGTQDGRMTAGRRAEMTGQTANTTCASRRTTSHGAYRMRPN